MSVENKNIYISYWLLLITILVGLMIIVGGLTRLTDSGLSITRWDLFTGILPPITDRQWDVAFSLYKKIPEYKLQNFNMTMDEFKYIYWWEFVHRFLGRVIGLFFIIPLIYFNYLKLLSKNFLKSLYSIFVLILLQGVIGWYMVKSGLTERTDVSHYRLSIHLLMAFIIFILLFWNYLTYTKKNFNEIKNNIPYYLPNILLILIMGQITLGALVSGLDAGQIYNTWPLMNGSIFPDDTDVKNLVIFNIFNEPSVLQFLHRKTAYLILIFFVFLLYISIKTNSFKHFKNIFYLIGIVLLIQIILGIVTLLSNVNIAVASLHQIGSIFLILSIVYLIFKNRKI